MKYLRRLLESKIIKLYKQFPVITLNGARQAGKSTILDHLLGTSMRRVVFDPVVLPAKLELHVAEGLIERRIHVGALLFGRDTQILAQHGNFGDMVELLHIHDHMDHFDLQRILVELRDGERSVGRCRVRGGEVLEEAGVLPDLVGAGCPRRQREVDLRIPDAVAAQQPQLVLLDLKLEDEQQDGGQGLLQRLRTNWPLLPIIVVTGTCTDEATHQRIQELGALECYHKPGDVRTLQRKVFQLAAQLPPRAQAGA